LTINAVSVAVENFMLGATPDAVVPALLIDPRRGPEAEPLRRALAAAP
jgi:hypothetical protein